MDRDSARLTLAGALLGLLALSATLVAGLRPPAPREEASERLAPAVSEALGPFASEAVPVLAHRLRISSDSHKEPVRIVERILSEVRVPLENL